MIGGKGEWHVVVDMQLVRFLDWKEVVEVALKAYRPFSQERLRTLPQRASDTVDLRWFLFDESYQCLWQPSPSQDLQFGRLTSAELISTWNQKWVTDLAADTKREETCSSKNCGCSKNIREVARHYVERPSSVASWRQGQTA